MTLPQSGCQCLPSRAAGEGYSHSLSLQTEYEPSRISLLALSLSSSSFRLTVSVAMWENPNMHLVMNMLPRVFLLREYGLHLSSGYFCTGWDRFLDWVCDRPLFPVYESENSLGGHFSWAIEHCISTGGLGIEEPSMHNTLPVTIPRTAPFTNTIRKNVWHLRGNFWTLKWDRQCRAFWCCYRKTHRWAFPSGRYVWQVVLGTNEIEWMSSHSRIMHFSSPRWMSQFCLVPHMVCSMVLKFSSNCSSDVWIFLKVHQLTLVRLLWSAGYCRL